MSVSDDGEPDLDVIESAIEEMKQTVEMLDSILVALRELFARTGGLQIVYNGESTPLGTLLHLWKEEYEQDMIHRITWGQFVIEKLNESM